MKMLKRWLLIGAVAALLVMISSVPGQTMLITPQPTPYFTSPSNLDAFDVAAVPPGWDEAAALLTPSHLRPLSDDINGDAVVDLADLGFFQHEIDQAFIDISTDQVHWQVLDVDTTSAEQARDNIRWFTGYPTTGSPMGNGEGTFGWTTSFNTSGMPDGLYWLRTIFSGTWGTNLTDMPVFLDRNPPRPRFLSPGWEETVKEVTTVTIERLFPSTVPLVQLEVAVQDKAKGKNIVIGDTTVTQTGLGHHDQRDRTAATGGGMHCGPTAVKNALERLIPTKDTSENIDRIKALARKMGTSDNSGTTNGNLDKGLRDYLKEIGKDGSYTVTWHWTGVRNNGSVASRPRWTDFETALRSGESVVILMLHYAGPGPDGIKGTADDLYDAGHYITGEDKDSKPKAPNVYKVSFVDPWGNGTTAATRDSTWTTSNSTGTADTIDYDPPWTGAADSSGWEVRDIWEISPKPNSPPPGYISLGVDATDSDGAWAVPWDTRDLPDGYHVLWAEYLDANGNKGRAKQVVRVDNPISLDVTPAAPDGDNDWYKTKPQLKLTRDETPGTTYHQWDSTGSPGWQVDSFFDVFVDIDLEVTPTPDGAHTLYYYSDDTTNGTTTVRSKNLKFDLHNPAGALVINGGAAATKSTAADLSLSATDGAGSGVAEMKFSNDGVNWSAWEPYAAIKAWNITAGDGPKVVYVKFKDAAGRYSAPASDTINLDTAGPLAAVFSPAVSSSVSKNRTFGVSWVGVDPVPGSGNSFFDVFYEVNGDGVWKPWLTHTPAAAANFTGALGKTYRFKVRGADVAGNVGVWSAVSKTEVPFDQGSHIVKRVGFNGTISKASSNYFMGTARYSVAAGERVVYSIKGDDFRLIAQKGKGNGRAEIWINGVYKKTIDTGAPTTKWRQVVYSVQWATIKTRTVAVVNKGTPGRPKIVLDAHVAGD